ncbi:MAG: hypothetical protein V7K73_21850, partial [Nostoc sp.]
WAVCGFRVVVLEDYNSTTSALFLYSFFGYSIASARSLTFCVTSAVLRFNKARSCSLDRNTLKRAPIFQLPRYVHSPYLLIFT